MGLGQGSLLAGAFVVTLSSRGAVTLVLLTCHAVCVCVCVSVSVCALVIFQIERAMVLNEYSDDELEGQVPAAEPAENESEKPDEGVGQASGGTGKGRGRGRGKGRGGAAATLAKGMINMDVTDDMCWQDFLKDAECASNPQHQRLAKDRWRKALRKKDHKRKKGKQLL